MIPLDFTIKTERLLLRCLELKDAELVMEVGKISDFTNGMTWDPHKSFWTAIEHIGSNRQSWIKGVDYTFSIDMDEQHVGRLGMYPLSGGTWKEGDWVLGYWLHPDFQGKGILTEAALAALDFAFKKLRVKRMLATHVHWNDKSGAVMQRLGMRHTKTDPKGFKKHGKEYEQLEYEITKEEWLDNNSNH